jgi:2-methylcitrate dehydratase PrpD
MTDGSPPAPDAGGAESALATWIAQLRREDVPDHIAERVKLLLLDAIASGVAGRSTAEVAAMESAATAFGGAGAITVIAGGRLSVAGAVLLNGYEITAATICDVHRPTLCHVTPVVVPPALAIAENRAKGGAALVTALSAGFETTVRTGLATDYSALRSRGWHAPGVVGPFGAAAAVASLLQLDVETTRHALGFAGSQSAGTFAGLGTSQVKFHQARGAVSGLLAALVASEGFDASPRILTAPDGGLFNAYANGGQPERLIRELGGRWELLTISLRRWPAASSLQPVIEAAIALSAKVDAGDLENATIEVGLPEGSYRLNGTGGWGDQLAAFQSARYVTAATLRDGRLWLDQFSPERLADSSVTALAKRVTVSIDPALAPSAATLSVQVEGGPTLSRKIDTPRGDPERPLGPNEVVEKLRAAADGTTIAPRVHEIAERIATLDAEASLEPLLRLLRA